MDYIPSMFHFDQTDHVHEYHHLQLSSTTTPCSQQDADHKRRQKSSDSVDVDDNPIDSKKKKIMHRDIERQRRQEMTTLYKSLRSLLPLQYIKGKRSMSDHMNETVNYIKDLQNKIQESTEKRDQLQRFSSSSFAAASECSQNHDSTVTVGPCLAGVEVVVNTSSLTKLGLPLSRVLQILIGEGLIILNCISTKINERLLHSIQSEVTNGRSIDLFELQRKILNLTKPSSN